MSKSKKKRNKPYRGEDASPAATGPVVHHYTAVQRSAVGEWWHEKKRTVKIVALATGGTALVAWFLYEAARIIL